MSIGNDLLGLLQTLSSILINDLLFNTNIVLPHILTPKNNQKTNSSTAIAFNNIIQDDHAISSPCLVKKVQVVQTPCIFIHNLVLAFFYSKVILAFTIHNKICE